MSSCKSCAYLNSDAGDFWAHHVSLDAHPRLASRLAAQHGFQGDEADGCPLRDRLVAILAFVLAIPMPRRAIVMEWLCNGRAVTRMMCTDYRRNHAQLTREIDASGIVAFLEALEGVKP